MRTFVAVEFGEAIRERLGLAQQRLRAAQAGIKWVDPKIMHLTLKFLGEIDDGAEGDVAAAMAAAVRGVAPFEVRVAGLGSFPPHGAPRVVWAGIEDRSRSLATLHERIESELDPLGIEREDRPFQAHLTLGRAKDARGGQALRALIEQQRSTEFGLQAVEELVLFRSVLTASGPTYTPLRRQRL